MIVFWASSSRLGVAPKAWIEPSLIAEMPSGGVARLIVE